MNAIFIALGLLLGPVYLVISLIGGAFFYPLFRLYFKLGSRS